MSDRLTPFVQPLSREPGGHDGLETVLVRLAQVMALLCPLMFLTSMTGMELASKSLFLAVVGLVLIDYRHRDARVLHGMRSPVHVFLIIYTLATLSGIFLMVDDPETRTSALHDQRWVIQFYAYLYFFHRCLDDSWRRYIPIYAVALCLLGAFAIGQFLYGWDRPRSNASLTLWGEYYRVVGLFNLANTFAGVAGMATFLLLGFAAAEYQSASGQKARAAGYAVAVVFGMACVIVSLTRGAWLSAAVTLVIVTAYWRVRLAVGAAICILLIGTVAYQVSPLLEARFDSIFDPDFIANKTRFDLWRANWEMIKDAPITGLGGEQNVAALPAYFQQLGLPADTLSGHAHNNLLQIWAGQGLIPLLCYLCFSAWFVWRAFALGFRQRPGLFLRGIGLGSFSAQMYFHLIGLTECNFADLKVNHLLIYIWALTLAADHRSTISDVPARSSHH